MATRNIEKIKLSGIHPISPEEGLAALNIFSRPQFSFLCARVVAKINWKTILIQNRPNPYLFEDFLQQINHSNSAKTKEIEIDNEQLKAVLPITITNIIKRFLDREVSRNEPLLQAGIDSLGAIEIKSQIERLAGLDLPATMLLDYPTIEEIEKYLTSSIQKKMKETQKQIPATSIQFIKNGNLAARTKKDINALILKILEKYSKQKVDGVTDLVTAGLDSLAVQRVVDDLSQTLEVKLPATLLYDYPSMSELKEKIVNILEIETNFDGSEVKHPEDEETRNCTNPDKMVKGLVFAQPDEHNKLPILTKEGYYSVPSITKLRRMSIKQLSSIQRLTIGRHNVGEISFLYPVDLRSANLDEIVQIKRGKIVLYPLAESKPPPGQELNVPALLTFYKIKNKKIKSSLFRGVLHQAAARMGAVMVHYDEDEGTWIVKIDSA